MKTTVEISDAIGEAARRAAEREGTTLKALVEEGLRRVLDDRARRQRFRLREASVSGKGLNPALAGASWERILEMSYEGRS
ncbi:MAG: DUF2191 domain-containing protein [Acidobacteria bacterium]|nr:MAG: DUF2191 domain-containing protein [Acidobacteriota bacterium]RPJ76085.1 MAG: DUF2191 domain-containing protein [Acidobacteriota bacterium]